MIGGPKGEVSEPLFLKGPAGSLRCSRHPGAHQPLGTHDPFFLEVVLLNFSLLSSEF